MSILLRFSVPSPQPKLLVTAIIQLLVATLAVVAAAPVALPGCPEACGSITVPYPFGIRQGCSRPGFNLTCDETSHPPNLFLGDGVRVDAISLADGTVRVLSKIVNSLTPLNGSTSIRWSGGLMPNATISVSSEHNDFVVVGCNVIARLVANYSDVNQHFSVSACATLCDRLPEPALPEPEDTPPPCSGVGCCHTTIASDMPAYEVQFKDFPQTSDPSSWSDDGAFRQDAPFGAAIVDRSWFSENVSAMLNDPFGRGHRGRVTVVPTVLYWWLDPERDADVVFLDPNVSLWRCIGLNSVVDSVVDLGVGGKQLRCSCLEGYEGNPYVVQGCQDIDECQQRDVYSCLHGTCINMPGTYRCLAKKSIISLPALNTSVASIYYILKAI